MAEKLNFYARFAKVQKLLKAPKNQYNSFGKYKYRSCEDILESAKPLCIENDMFLTVSDEVVSVGERYYIKSTATITDFSGDCKLSNTAYARESLEKKGMDDSQITGTASSYARKYALNGLFCIDDTKDADTDEYASVTKGSKSQQNVTTCTQCGGEIKSYTKSDGTVVSAVDVAKGCGGLCLKCFTANKKGTK